MNNSYLKHFPSIEHFDIDNDLYNQKLLSRGQVFKLIRTGLYRDHFQKGKIYKTSWNELCECYEIIKTSTHQEAEETTLYIPNKKRIELFEKYGPYDMVLFVPVCGLFFCSVKDEYESSDDKYYNPGIVYRNKLYMYDTDLDKKIKLKLDYTDYFDTNDNLIFTSVMIDPEIIDIVFSMDDIDAIRFVLASTRFIRLFTRKWHRRYDYGYSEIDSVFKLYQLLTTSKSHSMEYIFGD